MIIRKRKLKISSMHTQEKLVVINKKYEKRETNREKAAEKAAKLEVAIEKELLNRLKSGTFYNLDQQAFQKKLNEEQIIEETEYNVDEDDEENELEYDDEEDDSEAILQEVDDEDELSMLEEEEERDRDQADVEDLAEGQESSSGKKGKSIKKRPRVNIGYEDDEQAIEQEYEYNEPVVTKKRQKMTNSKQ